MKFTGFPFWLVVCYYGCGDRGSPEPAPESNLTGAVSSLSRGKLPHHPASPTLSPAPTAHGSISSISAVSSKSIPVLPVAPRARPGAPGKGPNTVTGPVVPLPLSWAAVDGMLPQGNLGEYLYSLFNEDVQRACSSMYRIELMIYEALVLSRHAGWSAPEIWRRTAGDRLLEIASLPGISCRHEFAKAALTLATNIPNAAVAPAEFAQNSGLAQFCRNSLLLVRETLARETPWTFAVGYRMERERITAAFAVDLPMYCPEVLDTIALKEVAVHQYILRVKLAVRVSFGSNINVHRATVFGDSLRFLNGAVGDMYSGLPGVRFIGEPGLDAGGVRRDWYATVNRALFESNSTDPAGSLFKRQSGAEYNMLDLTKVFNAATRPRYTATGRLLAFSLANRLPNGAPLPRFFWAGLLNQDRVLEEDLQLDNPAVYREIQTVKRDGETHIRAVHMLDPADPAPTVAEYVADLIDMAYPAAAADRMAAIREGFNDVIPIQNLTRNFNYSDVHAFVYGDPQISLDDLKAHTQYLAPYNATSQPVVWLWHWLATQENDMKRKYVQFVTGLSQLPLGGFAGLNDRMQIGQSGYGDLAPRSHTCFFRLDLPNYATYEKLAEWMPVALNSDGFGMV